MAQEAKKEKSQYYIRRHTLGDAWVGYGFMRKSINITEAFWKAPEKYTVSILTTWRPDENEGPFHRNWVVNVAASRIEPGWV